MKQIKSKKKIYKIVELYDFPGNYLTLEYTVIEFFKHINNYNSSFNITKEEFKAISEKYKRKYLNTKVSMITEVINIYCECSDWDLYCIGRGESLDDYIITFFKYE